VQGGSDGCLDTLGDGPRVENPRPPRRRLDLDGRERGERINDAKRGGAQVGKALFCAVSVPLLSHYKLRLSMRTSP